MEILLGKEYQVIMGFQYMEEGNVIHLLALPINNSNKLGFRTTSKRDMVIGKEFIEMAIKDFLYSIIMNSNFLTKERKKK